MFVKCSTVLDLHGDIRRTTALPFPNHMGYSKYRQIKSHFVLPRTAGKTHTRGIRSQQFFAWQSGDSQLYLIFSRKFYHIPTQILKQQELSQFSFFPAFGIISSSVLLPSPVWLGARDPHQFGKGGWGEEQGGGSRYPHLFLLPWEARKSLHISHPSSWFSLIESEVYLHTKFS